MRARALTHSTESAVRVAVSCLARGNTCNEVSMLCRWIEDACENGVILRTRNYCSSRGEIQGLVWSGPSRGQRQQARGRRLHSLSHAATAAAPRKARPAPLCTRSTMSTAQILRTEEVYSRERKPSSSERHFLLRIRTCLCLFQSPSPLPPATEDALKNPQKNTRSQPFGAGAQRRTVCPHIQHGVLCARVSSPASDTTNTAHEVGYFVPVAK